MVVRDQTELARAKQPRMTQILNLTFLAPEIQEEILFLDSDAAVSEKALRPITVEASWAVQRRMWQVRLPQSCSPIHRVSAVTERS